MRMPWDIDFASLSQPLKEGIRALAALNAKLDFAEAKWRDKQPFLEMHGYMLRPRYRPGWVPSWDLPENADIDPHLFEDYISAPPRLSHMDGRRMSDGRLVYLKRLRTDSDELRIAKMLYTPENASDAHNHCVPILDSFQDDIDQAISYLVMPFLRPIDMPAFSTVADVVDFVDQILEGLAFIHSHDVAHRDCAYRNVMMDADALFPDGYHPVRLTHDLTAQHEVHPLPRSKGQIKYYYVDFGLSVHIPPGQTRSVVGGYGQDQDPPELSAVVPYDPFKLDIFVVRNMIKTMAYDVYGNVEFLEPLIKAMTRAKPTKRPDIYKAEKQWQKLKANLTVSQESWRLKSRGELWPQTLALDGWLLLGRGARASKSLLSWVSDIQG